MAHFIAGLIGQAEHLRLIAEVHEFDGPYPLEMGFSFLPLDDSQLRQLADVTFDNALSHFEHLSSSFLARLTEWSLGGEFAYVETEYFGGPGVQGAILINDGEIVFGPEHNLDDDYPISKALKLMGVAKGDAFDEFEAIGLGSVRQNDDFRHRARQ